MKKLILVVSFLLILPVYAADYVVLPKEHAKTILGQCSRNAPSYESEWTPTKEQIEELEEIIMRLEDLIPLEDVKKKNVGIEFLSIVPQTLCDKLSGCDDPGFVPARGVQ